MNVIQGFIELTDAVHETIGMLNVDYIVHFDNLPNSNQARILLKAQNMTGATYREFAVKESYQQVKDLISMARTKS